MGLAYIRFTNEIDIQKAIEELNKIIIDNRLLQAKQIHNLINFDCNGYEFTHRIKWQKQNQLLKIDEIELRFNHNT